MSANNKDVPDSYPYFLTEDWPPPYRADRIARLLDATPRQTVASMAGIAADTYSAAAHDLLPLMLQVRPESPRDAWAVMRLRRWDDRMRRDGTAPLLFMAWLRELNRALFAKPLGRSFEAYWGPNPLAIRRILARDHGWCVPPSGAEGDCGRVLAESLRAVLRGIRHRLGGDPRNWRWGALHRARFLNPVLAQVPLLGGLFSPALPAGGADNTVDAGLTQFASARDPFLDIGGPSLRMVLDFADLAHSRFMVAPGESGNPLSSFYANIAAPLRTAPQARQWDDPMLQRTSLPMP